MTNIPVTTCTVFTHTKEEMIDRVTKQGWHTWHNYNYWVHPNIVSDSKQLDYTNYGMTLEEAFMYDLSNKIKPNWLHKILNKAGYRKKDKQGGSTITKPLTYK